MQASRFAHFRPNGNAPLRVFGRHFADGRCPQPAFFRSPRRFAAFRFRHGAIGSAGEPARPCRTGSSHSLPSSSTRRRKAINGCTKS